ncbi:MAG: SRPBCC domain-containing protein [Rhodospirillaceae bacterium]|jgi:uncharacterized protein YndB with AHSA1/START domain|nr:SRPBCC domain-containing protein [Rhodospirillaceae bacterium]
MSNVTTISKTVFFNASRDTVWSYLTKKEKLAVWFHPTEKDLHADEDYVCLATGEDGEPARKIWGRVLEMNEPEKLVMTFIIDPFEGAETTVTWLLESAAGGTRLTLRHQGIAEATGPAALPFLTALDQGWDRHLDGLRSAAAQ